MGSMKSLNLLLGCDIGGAEELGQLGVIYFPTNGDPFFSAFFFHFFGQFFSSFVGGHSKRASKQASKASKQSK